MPAAASTPAASWRMARMSAARRSCVRRCSPRPDQFVQTLTEKLMTFALGRSVTYQDMPTVRAIVHRAAADHYRFEDLVAGIVRKRCL